MTTTCPRSRRDAEGASCAHVVHAATPVRCVRILLEPHRRRAAEVERAELHDRSEGVRRVQAHADRRPTVPVWVVGSPSSG